jgi:hypothetical protein
MTILSLDISAQSATAALATACIDSDTVTPWAISQWSCTRLGEASMTLPEVEQRYQALSPISLAWLKRLRR